MTRRLMRYLFILTLAAVAASCSNGGGSGHRGLSSVTLAIGGGSGAGARHLVPPLVATVTITITGADMTTIAATVPVTPPADVNLTFSVPNGTGRTFAVEARDAGGVAAYRGSATADLDGTPVTVNIPLTALFFAGTKQFGTAAYDEADAIARDASGNLFIVGTTAGNLEGNTNNGSLDAYVMKLDSTGAKLWTKLIGSAADESAFGVAADAAGGVYVFGITTGGLDGNTQTGLVDCFVTSYDASGSRQWTRQFGGAQGLCEAGAAVSDAAGNLYVAGYTDRALGGQTVSGGYDAFAVKYDNAGTVQWTTVVGTIYNDYANGIALDSAGNVLVAGSTYGSLGTAQNLNPDGTTSDLFGAKLSAAAGSLLQTVQFGTVENDDAWAVAADGAGNFYLAGATYGGLDGNTNAGYADVVVVKYDASGAKQWTRQLGSTGNDIARAAAVDLAGNVVLTGRTNGGLDGNTNGGGYDLFLLAYGGSGSKPYQARQDGSVLDDGGLGILSAASGNLYVTGTTKGGLDGNTNAGDADGFLQAYDANGVRQ